MTCPHTTTRDYWQEDEDYWTGESLGGHWETEITHTTKDISIGSYQCTQCKQVMYYTGNWKKYYEGVK